MSDDDRSGAQLPDPDERPCDDCGHVWFAGERHHGYVDAGTEDPEELIVLCALCRRQRLMPQPEPKPDWW